MNQTKHNIVIQQFPKQGVLSESYSPLQNLIKNNSLGEFNTTNLSYTLKNFLDMDTQLSYDDSINLILNNNYDIPRIINTQFRVLGQNQYEYLTRNQNLTTNLYDDTTVSSSTDLFLRSAEWPLIDLVNVDSNGQLPGGNYVFYIKYCDEDDNETEIISESGIVSVFQGDTPSTVHGTLLDERTNKSIKLYISNIDRTYNRFYIYFSRDTSDLNGILLTKYYKILTPYKMTDNGEITITGYENIVESSRDELFVKYNYFTAAKTHAITQNMLFLGNVQTSEHNYPLLQQLSFKIAVKLNQKINSIGYINSDYSRNWISYDEYYNPNNIYYHLGYWPDEYYSLGICYILADGTVTNSFALLGGTLALDRWHNENNTQDINYPVNELLDEETLSNTGGVFKLSNVEVINHINQTINPLYFEFKFTDEVLEELNKLNVVGYFFTRTKRTPTSLFQGLSVGIDKESGVPLPYVASGVKTGYIAESFLTDEDEPKLVNDVDKHLRSTEDVDNSALLSLDAMVIPQIKNILSWNEYFLQEEYKCSLESNAGDRKYDITSYTRSNNNVTASLVYIEKDTPSFYINGHYFSTRAGSAESVKDFSFFKERSVTIEKPRNLLRGSYCPIVACSEKLFPSTIYTVKNKVTPTTWVKTLINNNSPYFAITNRYKLSTTFKDTLIEAYRGDCYTNTVTIRINKNFIDPLLPSNKNILDENTWHKNFSSFDKMNDKEVGEENSWFNINLSDVNAVSLGLWVTFKCLSNYNLGVRSIDKSNITILNQLGSDCMFYPISGITTDKYPDSQLLNSGYSNTLSRKSYNKWISTSYENYNFENRIAFSNVASTKMFTNGFRVFQGMAYQDIDKQFGQIVKLFPYGQNLLCVFEHGLAVVPINEKALLSTQEGLSIHLYGSGVLQEQVSVISPDYGSTWMESLIKTPNAYYGVDTSARKIWKFNNTDGFVCISDFKIQSFLNEELTVDWTDSFFMGATNVRTHYNNFKGDVIFTFYKEDKAYSICYNELNKMWISRYTWLPLLSANIDNHMYSFDRSVIAEYVNLYKQTQKLNGIVCENPIFNNDDSVVFKYNGTVPASLKLKSIVWKDSEYPIYNEFKLITLKGKFKGIYYPQGIKGFMYNGGSVNDNSIYANKPLYVDVNNHASGWKQIVDHTESGDSYANIPQGDSINTYRVSEFNNVGENKITSVIPVIYKVDSEEGDYDDVQLYNIVLEYAANDNTYKLLVPKAFPDKTLKVKLQAVLDGQSNILEEYEFTLSDMQPDELYLYKHDINSDICTWYDTQEPFEYEFAVNQPFGMHKIFNDLIIISNNAEPNSIEVEVIGDVYDFKSVWKDTNINYINTLNITNNKVYTTYLKYNKTTNEYSFLMHQDCINMVTSGRRIGNISYIEGKWHAVLQPIYYKNKTSRLRDKWAKIRIKYSGEKLAIITAIQTLMNISYA